MIDLTLGNVAAGKVSETTALTTTIVGAGGLELLESRQKARPDPMAVMGRGVFLIGCSPDTGNLGVSALGYALSLGLRQRNSGLAIAIASCREGVRASADLPGVDELGLYMSRRWYRQGCIQTLGFRMGIGLTDPVTTAFSRHVIVDVSAGDSFSDLYGNKRFRAVATPKQLAVNQGLPLILAPQTYGPFRSSAVRATAAQLVRGAWSCWARDARSFEVLRSLLDGAFDPVRHRCGVDVAFSLPEESPPAADDPSLLSILEDDGRPLVGLNVSGLMWNNPEGTRTRYGFKADYRAAVTALARRMVVDGNARLLLIPHVVTPRGHYESDLDACEGVREALSDCRDSVWVAPAMTDPRHAKWLISRCNWFCGTRMHATIAGLSSGVPTAAICYSDKTLGVFETCGQGAQVADPRVLNTEEVVDHVWRSFERRDEVRQSLGQYLPRVLQTAEEQMDAIAECIRTAALHSAKL